MRTIDPKAIPTAELHQILVSAVAPRPIAFASTISESGEPNIAPYSFFNVFSSNPPTMVFSSNRRVSDGTTKDTLSNVEKNMEVVINVVPHSLVRQMTVASIQYPTGVSEFDKSGLTPLPSDLVKPFRIKESPVQFECKASKIISLGEEGGAGHLIVCEVVKIHLNEDILDEEGKINPHKIDLMGRLGRAFYVRASGEAIYKFYQPVMRIGIGYDQLPESIRLSNVFTGNNLGQLASLPHPPSKESIEHIKSQKEIEEILRGQQPIAALHQYAQRELAKENLELAAQIAWLGEYL
ncbi:MAG: flavin reductase family protein [Saprospiraceae bacterium]|nr:flavin reductase family protein [Saprospiraceae bacterium]